MGVPPEDSLKATPEYTALPDEYNRNAPHAEAKEDRPNRMRKAMLLLAVAGLATVGVFWSGLITKQSPVPPEAEATPVPTVTAAPTAKPVETPEATPEPTPTPSPTPVVLTGRIHIVVYADAPVSGGYENDVLADEWFDADTFEGYTLPTLPTMDGYTAQGYVLLASSGDAYLHRLYFDNELPRAIGSVPVGDTITVQDLGIVPLNDDGVHEAEVHVVWLTEGGHFWIEFYDDGEIFDKQEVGFPLYSEGLIYLAAFPAPERAGMTFNGWVDEGGIKVDALTYFDFYKPLKDAQSLEDRDWKTPIPCRLYASWMDAYGNETNPTVPTPDCTVIYYQTHSVTNAILILSDPPHTLSVHLSLWDDQVQDSAFEYDLTEEEIAGHFWKNNDIDLNDFYRKHAEEYEQMNSYVQAELIATLTYQTKYGEVGTVTHRQAVKAEDYVFVDYHAENEKPSDGVFPGCFVACVYSTPHDDLHFYTDPEYELQPGEFFVSVSVDNETIPPDRCRLVRLTDFTYEQDGVTYAYYTYCFVMEPPESFPKHGAAAVTVYQRFLNYNFLTGSTTVLDY